MQLGSGRAQRGGRTSDLLLEILNHTLEALSPTYHNLRLDCEPHER
jgi:hypothetical protein